MAAWLGCLEQSAPWPVRWSGKLLCCTAEFASCGICQANFARLMDCVVFTTFLMFVSGFGLFLLGPQTQKAPQRKHGDLFGSKAWGALQGCSSTRDQKAQPDRQCCGKANGGRIGPRASGISMFDRWAKFCITKCLMGTADETSSFAPVLLKCRLFPFPDKKYEQQTQFPTNMRQYLLC